MSLLCTAEELGHLEISSFRNLQNLKLQSYIWPVANPKGIIVFVHGVTSRLKFEFLKHDVRQPIVDPNTSEKTSSGMYPRVYNYKGSWIEAFNNIDFCSCGFDQQGHGESEGWNGTRCNVESFDDFAFDVLHFCILMNQKFNTDTTKINIPIFLLGVSMGGGVILRTLQLFRSILSNSVLPSRLTNESEKLPEVSLPSPPSLNEEISLLTIEAYKSIPLIGGISMCPNLDLGSVTKNFTNRILLPFASPASRFFPHLKVGSLAKNVMYPWVEEDRYNDDPIIGVYNDKIPARLSYENLKLGSRVSEDLSLFFDPGDNQNCSKLSVLLVTGKHDTLCNPCGTIKLYDQLEKKMSDVTLWILEDMWHYLTIEPGSENLMQRVVEWVSNRISIGTGKA